MVEAVCVELSCHGELCVNTCEKVCMVVVICVIVHGGSGVYVLMSVEVCVVVRVCSVCRADPAKLTKLQIDDDLYKQLTIN